MKFGFIAHASEQLDRNAFAFYDASRRHGILPDLRQEALATTSCIDFIHIPTFRSRAGATCEGRIVYLPMTAQEMVDRSEEAAQYVCEAARELERWGAGVIGLGGFTGIVGERGQRPRQHVRVPVTTGNSFTVYNAVRTAEVLARKLDLELEKQHAVVIGFPGSIGWALARILARRGLGITLVGRRDARYLERLVKQIQAESGNARIDVREGLSEAVREHDFVFSATSTGAMIDPAELPPYTVFLDIAVPGDVKYILEDNANLLYVYGGTFDLAEGVEYGGVLGRIFRNNIPGCVGETILLALEDHREPLSIGRELSIDSVELIGRYGHKHGLEVITPYDGFLSVPLSDELVAAFRRHVHGDDRRLAGSGARADGGGEARPARGGTEARGRASGSTLSEGTRSYLDADGARGRLLLGHHEGVRRAVIEALAAGSPFCEAEDGGLLERLAERLGAIAPVRSPRVAFATSLAAATLDALRVARAATGRAAILYTRGAAGGLDTEPGVLAPEFAAVPFNDRAALERALVERQPAAFLVGPLGVGERPAALPVLPAEGYLKQAAELCARHGALLVVNEGDTALGRTGTLFACEQAGIAPDVLLVGEQLGGGLAPLAAMITAQSRFETIAAVGARYQVREAVSVVAVAAAHATLDLILADKLWERAAERGAYFLARLQELARAHPEVIRAVSGWGLILGVELRSYADDESAEFFGDAFSLFNESLGRLPLVASHEGRRLIQGFFDELLAHANRVLLRRMTDENRRRLREEFGVHCRGEMNRYDLFPSLCVEIAEIDRVVAAFDGLCRDVDPFVAWRSRRLRTGEATRPGQVEDAPPRAAAGDAARATAPEGG